MTKIPTIEVYGTEQICASCVNAPSSKDTYEWLEAAISRKYKNQPFSISYIDIENPQLEEQHKDYAARIMEDEFFYPLVLIEGEVVGEGYIQLKPVYRELEKHGFKAEQ
ncbi:YuzD family protein [Planococcus sp. ISL-109]|uniref:YuzD family protein n=1 Tax=Planococcus sp. ISL-109 TaxID=2819166 RepID=UPI001BE9E36A|nr:YuzD family protein [Planococcus sp. ISL-109]MBT2583650.1 YuzD family protein [Planococcus sp. ISL-109]